MLLNTFSDKAFQIQFSLHIVVMIRSIDFLQEIVAVDVLTALKYCHKHTLRLLQHMETRLRKATVSVQKVAPFLKSGLYVIRKDRKHMFENMFLDLTYIDWSPQKIYCNDHKY